MYEWKSKQSKRWEENSKKNRGLHSALASFAALTRFMFAYSLLQARFSALCRAQCVAAPVFSAWNQTHVRELILLYSRWNNSDFQYFSNQIFKSAWWIYLKTAFLAVLLWNFHPSIFHIAFVLSVSLHQTTHSNNAVSVVKKILEKTTTMTKESSKESNALYFT